MYLTNRIHMQMHWHPSPFYWLFQLEQQRRYSYTAVTCTVWSSPSKIIRLESEAFKFKEVLETLTGPELRDWRFSFINYVLYDILPDDSKEAATIRRKAPRIYYNAITQILYRRSYNGILLRCLSRKKAKEALMEAHDGICEANQLGAKLEDRL